jgi:hypothetical protein
MRRLRTVTGNLTHTENLILIVILLWPEEYTIENLQHRVLTGVVYQVQECFLPELDEYTLQYGVLTGVVYQVQECFYLW